MDDDDYGLGPRADARRAASKPPPPSDASSRQQMADSGVAMPDGSFPIRNRSDLERAVRALGRANDPDAVKAHIRKRAKALGAEAWLKEHTSWA